MPAKNNYYIDLKKMDYNRCLKLQYDLVNLREENKIPDTIVFVEHNNVYTIGRKADPENYKNINVIKTDRGGDVTYHGEGQLVAYFIFDVNIDGKREIRKFLEKIENSYIGMLNNNGYEAMLDEEPGIWINTANGKKKVASVGLAIKDHISYHGVAMNINERSLYGFRMINPCGMNSNIMSYIKMERENAIDQLLKSFAGYFGEFEKIELNDILI